MANTSHYNGLKQYKDKYNIITYNTTFYNKIQYAEIKSRISKHDNL